MKQVREEGSTQLVKLDQSNFIASGGQAEVFGIGSKVYKIYTDPKFLIPKLKIQELSVLSEPYIIKPQKLVFDERDREVGYSAFRIPKNSHQLVQLYTKTFKADKKLDLNKCLEIVDFIRKGYLHIHKHNILVVDGNENNFIVSEDFKIVYFLDVDSYKTKTFPPVAVMPSIQDYSATGSNNRYDATENTDWYSFGIVSFNLITNIHPFKGKYQPFEGSNIPKDERLFERMKQNISVFNPNVTYPKAQVLDFNLIPKSYRDWYEAVFDKGLRCKPPDSFTASAQPLQPIKKAVSSVRFGITDLLKIEPDTLVFYSPDFFISANAVYDSSFKHLMNNTDHYVGALYSPREQHVLLIQKDKHGITIHNGSKTKNDLNIVCEDYQIIDNKIYIKRDDKYLEVVLMDTVSGLNFGEKLVSNVPPLSTRTFKTVTMANIFKTNYFYIVEGGKYYPSRIKELDDYKVINAFYQNHVLIVVGTKSGTYDKAIVKFAPDFQSYNVRIESDVDNVGINVAVLKNGVVAHVNDTVLEVFSNRVDKSQINNFVDRLISDTPLSLYTDGYRMLAMMVDGTFAQIKIL
ncbi:MAG TPA: hypothetical protein PLP33_25875 [Leptospiraceae bacterium]|nr:hypothetical protein [Leptospiraceae bacterium]